MQIVYNPTNQQTTMKNLELYNALRVVPSEALKTIASGRLKGYSDINPVWRIQKMTETFGPCGIGWKYVITKQWCETYGNTVKAFCNIDLFVKTDGEWSEAIPGTGGASAVTQEKAGPYFSDECHKMALTDALSVAMKSLGVAADIYFAKGKNLYDPSTKYAMQEWQAQQAAKPQSTRDAIAQALNNANDRKTLGDIAKANAWIANDTEMRAIYNKKKSELQ